VSRTDRREFLGRIGSAGLAIPTGRLGALQTGADVWGVQASQGVSSVSYDLLIAGGRVIDPSQNVSAERDVAILGGKIARVDANIPRGQARQVFDAKGKIVTPGLIDLHTHVYRYGVSFSVDPDVVGIQSGVTTVVDAGTAGAAMFPAFRKYVIDASPTRIYALLNISKIGLLVVTNQQIGYLDPNLIDARAAIRTILANRDRIVGIKVVLMGTRRDLPRDIAAMKAAREAADATGVPIMMHWSVEPELLALLKKGDILTHPFNAALPETMPHAFPNVFGAPGTQADKVLPQILALKDRGIWTDGQLGTTHHAWELSEKAMKQGWVPDVLSTDNATARDGSPASLLVPMSQYLHLGLPLERVVACATTNPARAINAPEKIGTLEPGAAADVAVLELEKGHFEFSDATGKTRLLTQQFLPVATVKGGIFFKGAPAATPAAGVRR
jgi:dihydroorotase